MWKVLWKKSIWEKQHHFLTTSAWSALNGNAKHVKKMSTITKYVRIQDLCRSKRKSTWLRETGRRHLFMVLWYARSCKEMCGAILWSGEQNNPATVQSRNSMPWRPSIQRRRIGIRWRIVKSLLSNCPKRPVFGSHWWTRHSMVSKQTCTSSHKKDQSLCQTLGSFDFLYSTPTQVNLSNIVNWERGSCIEISNPKTHQRGHSDWKRGPFQVWGDAGASMLAAHPAF